MDNIRSEILRELTRVLIRNFGVLEKNEFSCCGITLAQCHALVEIVRAECISLIEPANLLGLDKSTMSRMIDNLLKVKMVIREIDSENRRYVNIRLSENGMKFLKETEKSMDEYFDEIFVSIPEEKREQVLESLQLLIQVMANKKCCQE